MMTDPSDESDAQPQSEQDSTDSSSNAHKSRAKVERDVYNSGECRDSTSDPEDAAETFLRRCIEEVRSELAEKQELACVKGTSRAADAALMNFVARYVADHSDPQGFLRALRRSIFAQDPAPLHQEHSDA